MTTAHSPIRTRAQVLATTTAAPENEMMRAVLQELQQLREERRVEQREHRDFREQMETRLLERDAALTRLQEQFSEQRNNPQLSRSNIISCADGNATVGLVSREESSRIVRENSVPELSNSASACASSSRFEGINLGFKLKPDTFDGTGILREFISRFELIARANSWNDSSKIVALASCLRGEARSVVEAISDFGQLSFEKFNAKLELHFGEGLTQNHYSVFTNRRQKSGESFAALGSDLERLSRLAYPECNFAIRNKIACAQFVSAISDRFVKRTLQLEEITSLSLAVQRAGVIKTIQEENFERKSEGNFQKFQRNVDGKEKFNKEREGQKLRHNLRSLVKVQGKESIPGVKKVVPNAGLAVRRATSGLIVPRGGKTRFS